MFSGNFFLNTGYMSFGLFTSPFYNNTCCNCCNFQMPFFFNNFSFNFNQQLPLFQNAFNTPNYSDIFNFSYNTQPFQANFSYNNTPTFINSFYSFDSISLNNTQLGNRVTTSSTTRSTSTTSASKTTPRKSGLLREYNSSKGSLLASTAMHNAGFVIDSNTKKVTSKTKNPDKFTHCCARYVKAAIRDAGLGEYSNEGSAYQMTNSLRNNNNFKEISASTPLKEVPAGCILVYDRGVGGYSSKHGHIEIKTDDGRAVSDGITDYLYKRPSHIFMPV